MPASSQTPSQDGWRRTSLRGRPLVVTDDKPTFWDKAASGEWEPGLLALIETLLAPGDVFCDIGAWVGPTSLHAALCGAQVVGVEADPAAAARLAGNVAANPELASRIRIVQRAASPREGRLRLGAPRKPGDSMGSLLHADLPEHWDVETIAPAALLAIAEPVPPGRWLVKVDIEGGEYELLPALAAALDPARTRAVIAAFHPRLLTAAGWPAERIGVATGTCLEAFAGWRMRVVEGASEAPEPADPAEAALAGNITLLFTPPS
jgi:FkbM family methyltransferase